MQRQIHHVVTCGVEFSDTVVESVGEDCQRAVKPGVNSGYAFLSSTPVIRRKYLSDVCDISNQGIFDDDSNIIQDKCVRKRVEVGTRGEEHQQGQE